MRRGLFIGVVVLAAALVVGAWSLWRPGPARETVVDVPRGAPASRVLDVLHHRGLLPFPLTGRLYLALAGGGRELHYGRYRFAAGVRPVEVIRQVLEGRVATVAVTVVEGATLAEIAATMTAAGIGDAAGWREAGTHVEWLRPLVRNASSLEGFLFPDTYRFAEGTPAAIAAHAMVRRFLVVWGEETAGLDELWGTPLQVVTLASLVEAETAVPGERPLIAGVFLHRLRLGMLLQCDPTVIYALKRRGAWWGSLSRADLAVDDPYNTYRYPGLPPGPIGSPGRQALRAALRPQPTPYLYFVATPSGGHHFSRTLREHNRAVARLRRSGR